MTLTIPAWPRRVLAGLVCLLAVCIASASRADYKLNSGDVVEISVFGSQEFKRRATVNIDGDLSVPLLGEVRASGLTIPGLRTRLRDMLMSKDIIRRPDVTVDLVELRPFFINGDVAKPGQHPYQPNLTVRRAVAVAGGYDLLRLKVENPLLAAAETRSQYEGLWADFVRRQARVTGLSAELDGKAQLDLAALNEAPIAKRVVGEIVQLEQDHFAARIRDAAKEREYLQRAFAFAQTSVAQLYAGLEQEAIGSKQRTDSLARTSELSAKGLTIATRVFDEQRAATVQRSRELETAARLADAQQRMEETGRKLNRLEDDRRMVTSHALQDAIVELERTRTQLQGVGEKLLYIGAIKSLLSRGGRNPPQISIYRTIDDKPTWITADESTEVQPGDVVDIVFSQKQLMLNGTN